MMTRKHNFCLFLQLIFFFSLSAQIPQEGLIGHYLFEQADLGDSSGYHHHLDSDGFMVDQTTDRFSRTDKALLLNGTYVGIPDPSIYNFADSSSNMSISIWIRPDVLPNDWIPLVTKWPGFGRGGYFMGINPGSKKIRWNLNLSNLGQPIESQTEPVVGQWYHIVVTYDGNESNMFINGALEVSATYGGPMVAANFAPFAIGVQGDGFSFTTFQGAIDDVLIYDRAVSQEEVMRLFDQYATSTESELASLSSLVLFPNPASDQILIQHEGLRGTANVHIYDMKGRLIHQQLLTSAPVDIQHLPPSVYQVVLVQENQLLGSQKLIKQ